MQPMHALDLREQRFRAQQRLAELEDGPEKQELEEAVARFQEICRHEHFDEDPAKGWRCRDCDLTRPPEPAEEPAAATADPVVS